MGKRKTRDEDYIRKKIQKLEKKLKDLPPSSPKPREDLTPPRPRSPVHVEEPEVDDESPTEDDQLPLEFLQALGKEGEEEAEFGDPIRPELVLRWSKIMSEGLGKDDACYVVTFQNKSCSNQLNADQIIKMLIHMENRRVTDAWFVKHFTRFRRSGLLDGIPLVYCGAEAIKKRGISEMTWPVQEGLIQNWDEMEKLWYHVFYKELCVPPESTKIMHSVHPLAPERDKDRMAEIFFESFAVNALYIAKSPSLVLNAYSRTSGVVWEQGYSCCYAAPVFEGFPLKHATVTSPLTGKMLTDRLQNLMFKAGYSFTTPFEIDLVDKIKKDICYISQDYGKELVATAGFDESKARYNLPDGQHILLGEERFLCPEVLFKPELEGLKCRNIIDVICRSIDLCDLDYRSIFYNNIVFSGGSSMVTGLVNRATNELTHLMKKKRPDVKVNIDAMSNRLNAAWAGGSMLATLPNMKEFWLTKEEYADLGSDRVQFKFF